MPRYADILVDVPLKRTFTYLIPEELRDDSLFGRRAVVPFGSREVTGYIVGVRDTDDSAFKLKELKRMIDSEPVFTEKTLALARWIARFYLCSEGEAISLIIPGGRRDSAYGGLEQDEAFSFERIERLSAEQESALSSILDSDERMFYLHGVTGSGKSEVYLRAAEAVIAEGKGVIYLVPEITLTHQLATLVAGRFSSRVAILHSALTPSQRLKQWRRILKGEVDLVIGARSAVFAPVENLGLIIIDEEHETSYKSGNTPRYHARQVAQHRILQEGARLVMGSATPSLEAYHLMHKTRAIMPLLLTKRVAGGALPKVEVVNLLGEKRTISARLEHLMKETLRAKKQVILFLNRRGFSYFFHCRSCGFELRCPHCDVSLTYHKQKGRLVCHYCGHTQSPMTSCPSCRSIDVGYSGYGTELVEEEVRSLFPFARLERLDTDTARKKGHTRGVLERFKNGETDILLGTQMVAKGLNFPHVELVGIVLADSGLHIPDFRAQERTFGLLVQVSGRAGRYTDKGRVVIQTFHPHNPAIVHALSGDLTAFYEGELLARKETDFPPYTRLVNITLRGRNREKVATEAEKLARLFGQATRAGGPGLLVAGECPIEKIASNWRYHLLIRGESAARTHHLVSTVLGSYTPPGTVHVEVDIDPLTLV
ncbi:MAG: primosomal protein N' [Spirochaetales bacterium]|nr:primosomal protein N' [Spirochaetales bacterium]